MNNLKIDTHSNLYHHHNFDFIAKAIEYYTKQKFQHIEVPWFVPSHINLITKPSFLHHEKSFYLTQNLFQQNEYELLGSAEQGFIYLALNNEIEEGINYVAFSPCFRTEPLIDKNHLYYFLKVELFSYQKIVHPNESIQIIDNAYQKMLNIYNCALDFFHLLLPENSNNIINTIELSNHSLDINLNDIEVGSYGNRLIQTEHHKNNHIVISYGTGLAEPRFSQNLK